MPYFFLVLFQDGKNVGWFHLASSLEVNSESRRSWNWIIIEMNLSQKKSEFFTFHLQQSEEKMEPEEITVSAEEDINIRNAKTKRKRVQTRIYLSP
jgi:hypothetical protein